jgi:hypothetical protein
MIRIRTDNKKDGERVFDDDSGFKLISISNGERNYNTILELWKPGTKERKTITIGPDELDKIIEQHQQRFPYAGVWKTRVQRIKMSNQKKISWLLE